MCDMTAAERWEMLAARYLAELARADMKAYRRANAAHENAAPERTFDRETIREVARMKRVVRVKRG